MKLAEHLVRCLKNEEVSVMFGLPGEENLDVMDALLDSDIRFVLTRHEQAAAFMADVWGRLSGRAGVCLATLGPGATNLITGVADAYLDRAPMVVLTGQVDLDSLHKESHQNIDLVEMFQPITKWNTQVVEPKIMSEAVRKAFKVAETEKPGPTHLDLPEDVARMNVEDAPLPVNRPRGAVPAPKEIERALTEIKNSVRPVIIAGNGVVRGGASDSLARFAESFNIPVVNTFMGKGALSYRNPLSMLTVGLHAQDTSDSGLDKADLVLAIGYDLVEYSPKAWNPGRDKRIVHIDTQPAEVDAYYNVQVGLVGKISSSLDMLSSNAFKHPAGAPSDVRDLALEELEGCANDRAFPLRPQRIISEIRKALGDDDIVISDVGAHKMWIARMYPAAKPNTCIISNGLAAMGISVPGAIAAKILYPEKRILAAVGDGGFMMNSQEIETAIREQAPFVTLIFRDDKFGLIDWKQMNVFKRTSHVDFANPDFVKYAESFGARGYRVQAADELGPILEDAFSHNVPSIIDCPVDYSENDSLTKKRGPLICSL